MKAINAGVGMEMVSGTYFKEAPQLIKQYKVKESTIDEAVRDILRIKFMLGLFDNPYVNEKAPCVFYEPSHLAAAKQAAIKAACEGHYNFINEIKEYGRRAAKLKKIFTDNGFNIVYDKDLDENIADGFYFTIAYKDMSGAELMKELLYYGISAISLETTGSNQQGLRACVSFIKDTQYLLIEERLKLFNTLNSKN